ncbi:aromatic ring-hydroxylating oxygenase subunit alpha, partial [Nocardia salmonicida]
MSKVVHEPATPHQWPRPTEGSWTQHYPELGTSMMSFEDSVSPEFFELEREAIFKRAWLNVGRVEQVPKTGSYFTKEIDIARTSIVVVRDRDGAVNAFHNVCRHRGNKLVWNEFPREETAGTCRQFTCKYHGWRYGLDGSLNFVQQEGEFFDLDTAELGLAPVHCDVWAGFIFVNLDVTPRQSLREFLGPMITDLDGYPFDKMTEWYEFKADNQSNWKLFADAFQEYYH